MKNRIKNFFPSLTFSSPFLTSLFPLLLTFLTLFAGSVASAQIPSSGLVGYWPFNGNANDESGNGINLTPQGTASLTTDRFNNPNSAYHFENSLDPSYLSFPNSAISQINNFSAGSISFWLNIHQFNVSNHYFGFDNSFFVKQRDGVNTQIYLGIKGGTQKFRFHLDGALPSGFNFSSNANIQLLTWTHITVTWNGSEQRIYINGVLDNSVASNAILSNMTDANYIQMGAIPLGSYGANSDLDEFSIYNRALTPTEISQIYSAQSVPTPAPPCPTLATNLQTGLVGYWPFCGNANDESGNGNNGTVNGTTLTTDRFGNANSAYSFNGNGNKIEIPNSTSLNPSQISFSFWGFFNSGNCGILSKVDPSTPENYSYSLIHNFLNDNGFYSAWNASGLCSYPVFSGGTFGPNGILSNSIWTHVVVTIDENGFCKQYMNGQLTHTYSGPPLNPCTSINSKLFFGMQWLGDPCWMNGKLDDICIWNRSLTPAEITQLYTDASAELPVVCTPFLGEDQTVCAGTSVTLAASGSSLACPTLPATLQNGLVGYWPFCGNANDASGNGNNGTVNGATLTTDRFGNANSAYSFDGVNDYIIQNSNSSFQSSALTFSSWTYALQLNQYFNCIVKKGNFSDAQNESYGFGLKQPNNIWTGVKGATCQPGQLWVNSEFSLNPNFINNWRHLVITYSNNLISVYVDGILVGSEIDPGFLDHCSGG